jgi:hypothetical protein
MTYTPSGGNAFISVSVAPSVLMVTVLFAGSGSAGSIEISTSVTFPVEESFVSGCADTCIVLSINNPSPVIKRSFKDVFSFFVHL